MGRCHGLELCPETHFCDFPRSKCDEIGIFHDWFQRKYPEKFNEVSNDYQRSSCSKESYVNTFRNFSRELPEFYFTFDDLKTGFDIMFEYFRGYIHKPLTYEELLLNMNPKAASGYPDFTTKNQAFQKDTCYQWYREGIKGNYLTGIWKASPKDEILSKDKIGCGERNFTCSHFPGYISSISHLKPQNDYLHDRWNLFPMRVGSSKYCGELKTLFEAHKNSRFTVKSMDVKGMEYDLNPMWHKALAYFRKGIYPDFDWDGLYNDIAFGKVLCAHCGKVVQKTHGNCSGHGGTIDDNDIIVVCILILAHLPVPTFNIQKLNEWCSVVGDDILYSGPLSYKELQIYFRMGGFGLKLEKETHSHEGAIFLGQRYEEGKVMSDRPNKLLAKLMFTNYKIRELPSTLVGIHLELYNNVKERKILENFAVWYRKTFKISVPLKSHGEANAIYEG